MQFIQIISVLFIIIILFHSLVFSPFETNKTYDVMNNQGQRLYFAEEKSNCFIRHLCGPSRPFTMTIYDNVGCDVITLHKALRWSCCWSNCCLQKVSKYYFYNVIRMYLSSFKKASTLGSMLKLRIVWDEICQREN